MWLEQNVHPGSTQFNLCTYYKMDFALDEERFVRAAEWVFAHYDALYVRLIQGADGVPEMVFDTSNAIRCERIDVSEDDDPEAAANAAVAEFSRRPFEMLGGPLARMAYIKSSRDCSYFAIVFHHITVDGWGSGAVITRISEAYDDFGNGRAPTLSGRPFAAYLEETTTDVSAIYREKATEFWKTVLSRQIPELSPRHRTGPGLRELGVTMEYFNLPRALADRLTAIAGHSNATLYHVLALALHYVSAKTFALDPLLLELPVLNRGKEDKETIGVFVETRNLPLPIENAAKISDNLNAVSKRVRELFRYYRLTPTELGKIYHDQGNTGHARGSIALSYITRDFGAVIDGRTVPLRISPQAHQSLPLTFYVFDTDPDRDIRIEFLYQKRIFNAVEARLFGERFLHVLGTIGERTDCVLGDIDVVPPSEHRLIHSMLNRGNESEFTSRPAIDAVIDRAKQTPDAIAVEDGARKVSYRECIEKAGAIARELVEKYGITSGDLVPLLLPRSAELIESELAVMMTGAAFVPMEIGNPEMRLSQIAADCSPKCVVTITSLNNKARAVSENTVHADAIPASSLPFEPLAKPDDIAYVIYTSGSTGKPKGVEIPHKSLAQHVASIGREIPLRDGAERCLLFHSPSFDASIECIFPPLVSGGTIVTTPHPQWTAYEIARHLVEKEITFICLSPAFALEFLKHLHDNPEEIRGNKVRTCIIGGDILHADTAQLWDDVFGPDARPVNIYGPTEITIAATCFTQPFGYHPDIGESIPIGHVYEGRSLRLLDDKGQDVPIGGEGELFIGGLGLARGYHNMPEETAKRFVTLGDGRRYYRSGDLVRLRADGEMIFRRRADTQVKVRGFRVETSEVEACLGSHPDVRECAVVAVKNELSGDCVLNAFAALKTDATINVAKLRAYLEERLPHYMIPRLSLMESLPKSDGGKIDRKSLLAAQTDSQPQSETNAANLPQGVVQEYLAFLWEQALGAKVRDAGMDFFELGGHSLLAAKLVATIGKSFRVDYPFPAFFEKSSIADTERKLDELIGDRAKVERIAAVRLELARLSPEEIQARLAKIHNAQK
jgi:amino acid adenylation domain-containing protein